MSLPNSPMDAHLELFGWPWHGLIRQPMVGAAHVLLPSGATHPINSWGTSDTHLFDAGMPAVEGPPDTEDMALWNKGIRRGALGEEVWSGRKFVSALVNGLFVGCVLDGVYYPHRFELVSRIISGVPCLESLAQYQSESGQVIYGRTILNAGALGVVLADFFEPVFMVEFLHWSSRGNRAIYKIYIAEDEGQGDIEACGIVEVVFDPVAQTSEIIVIADIDDCRGNVTSTSDSGAPTNYTRYRMPGGPVDLPAGAPPPDGWGPEYDTHTFTLGTYEASESRTAVVHAFYLPGDVIELVSLGYRLELTLSLPSFGQEQTTQMQIWTLSGEPAYMVVVETSGALDLEFPYDLDAAASVALNGEIVINDSGTLGGDYTSRLLITPLTALTLNVPLAAYVPLPMFAGGVVYVAYAAMSNNCVAMYAMAIDGGWTEPTGGVPYPDIDAVAYAEYSQVFYPGGTDGVRDRLNNPQNIDDADYYGFGTASWNPITGEVARGGGGFAYSWV